MRVLSHRCVPEKESLWESEKICCAPHVHASTPCLMHWSSKEHEQRSRLAVRTIMEATVIAVIGALDEPGKALLSRTLLCLGVRRAMDGVPAQCWEALQAHTTCKYAKPARRFHHYTGH